MKPIDISLGRQRRGNKRDLVVCFGEGGGFVGRGLSSDSPERKEREREEQLGGERRSNSPESQHQNAHRGGRGTSRALAPGVERGLRLN